MYPRLGDPVPDIVSISAAAKVAPGRFLGKPGPELDILLTIGHSLS